MEGEGDEAERVACSSLKLDRAGRCRRRRDEAEEKKLARRPSLKASKA